MPQAGRRRRLEAENYTQAGVSLQEEFFSSVRRGRAGITDPSGIEVKRVRDRSPAEADMSDAPKGCLDPWKGGDGMRERLRLA